MEAVGVWLGPYLDGRAVGNQPCDFLHFLVGDGDATIGPVDLRVKSADP